ncbi:MAG: hypothetical protein AAFX62_06910 [Pseudomonadota bacterium]
MRGSLLGCLILLTACAGSPTPIPEPKLANAGPPVVSGSLSLPARIGLLRLSEGRPTAVPAPEYARWRGAIAEVNRALLYPLRLTPLAPGVADPEPVSDYDFLALENGLDAVLVYELSVAVSEDPLTAGLTQLPFFGGVVPVSAATRASGRAVARLYSVGQPVALASTEARMTDAAIASVRQSEGSGRRMRALAEYALLHRMMPAAEDMIVGTVAAGR